MKSLKNRFIRPHTDRPPHPPCKKPVSYITLASRIHYIFSRILSKTYYITRTRLRLHLDPTPLTSVSLVKETQTHAVTNDMLRPNNEGGMLVMSCFSLVRILSRFYFWVSEITSANEWPRHSALSCSLLTLPEYAKSSPRTGHVTTTGMSIKQ